MADVNRDNKNWIVNQNRYAINVYIANLYPGNFEMLSWSCLDKNGNTFNPSYNLPSNSYFTTKTTGDWVPILLQKFQLPLLAVILLYSPVGLTPLKNIH